MIMKTASCGFVLIFFVRKVAEGLKLEITNFDEVHQKMTLHFEYGVSFPIDNCIHDAYVVQYGDYPVNFPKDIVLQKQP